MGGHLNYFKGYSVHYTFVGAHFPKKMFKKLVTLHRSLQDIFSIKPSIFHGFF